jgi:hypothetical protein
MSTIDLESAIQELLSIGNNTDRKARVVQLAPRLGVTTEALQAEYDRRKRLRQFTLTYLSTEDPGECFNAVQFAKRELARNGHDDIYQIMEHIESIGREVVPVGYVSPEEFDRRLQAAASDAMQKGREIERLSRGQAAVNWQDKLIECRDHRDLTPFVARSGEVKDPREFIEQMLRRSEFPSWEPTPGQERWILNIYGQRRI